MNHRKEIKTLIAVLLFAVMCIGFAFGSKAYASDYKYKVLDTRYNPSAQKLIDGTLAEEQAAASFEKEKKGFDFGTFFAIFALVVFPIGVFIVAFKTFKKFEESIPGAELNTLGNIRLKNKNTEQDEAIRKSYYKAQKRTYTEKNTLRASKPVKKTLPLISDSKSFSINDYFSSPIEENVKNPMLLNTSEITENKGVCLVEYKDKFSLIGYINQNIFLLSQFDSINNFRLKTRLSEKVENKDRYIVRCGNYKAVVEVSDTDMQLLLEL